MRKQKPGKGHVQGHVVSDRAKTQTHFPNWAYAFFHHISHPLWEMQREALMPKGAGTPWATCPILPTPSELCPAALRGQPSRLTGQLSPIARNNGHGHFHAKSLFGTCVLLSRSAILKLQVFTLCREIQELLEDIHLRFAGVISLHPPSPLIS